jgi:hypothetical protein
MSLLGTQLSACFEAVEYSVADHVAALRKTWLTPATLEQLAAFFVAA